ncbi:hypothetical protein [Xanthobacter autotrophicus]|uniref:hypothetical protein n=1 Tax=Xanthobacter autotrophicus TaxID=280 RepID=UPI00372A1BA5
MAPVPKKVTKADAADGLYKSKLRWKPKPLPVDLEELERFKVEKFKGSYHPDMCDHIIRLMAQGHSVSAVAGFIGVAKDTLFLWANQREALAHAVRIGQGLRVAFLEKLGREYADAQNHAGVAWTNYMLRSADQGYRNAGPLIEQNVTVTNAPAAVEFNEQLRGALDAIASKLAGNFTQPDESGRQVALPGPDDEDD